MIPSVSILLALSLPIVMILQNQKKRLRRPYLYTVGSFTFCAIAMLEELLKIKQRLNAGDIAGIEDTIGAVLLLCTLLLAMTLLLNLLTLSRVCRHQLNP